jgi:hypothetical protein
MLARLAADLLVLIHFSFIIFVVLGGLLALRWPKAAWAHIPAAAWGAWIEFSHGICPLTPLEQSLRAQADADSYDGSFIDHYLIPLIYPPGFDADTANLLGLLVLAFNGTIYAFVIYRRFKVNKSGIDAA